MSAALSDDDASDLGLAAGTGLLGALKYLQIDDILTTSLSG